MRTLTQFGKRVTAITALVIATAVILLLGFFVLADQAYRFHINQQAFNVLAILAIMPICCIVIAHVVCSFRNGDLA